MAYVLSYLGYYASTSEFGAYLLIFLGATLWGDLTAIAGAILAYHRFLDWVPLIAATFLGAFFGDNLIYQIGKRLRGTASGIWIEKHLPYRIKIEHFLNKNSLEALTLSKFIMGFNIPVLFMSGYMNVSTRTFVKSALLAAALWTTIIFPIGYLVATAFAGLGHFGYRRIETGIALVILTVIVFRFATHRTVERLDSVKAAVSDEDGQIDNAAKDQKT